MIGLDKISFWFFKDFVDVIIIFFIFLFNRLFLLVVFLFIWKMGKVVLIFKFGDWINVSNYRLIIILLVLSKIIEKVVYM